MLLIPALLFARDLPQLPAHQPGLDEKLGGQVPLDTEFLDETGRRVKLAELVDRPTILLPVYYKCSNVCNLMQGALAEVLPKLRLNPDEFRIVSISFDPEETPKIAQGSRRIYQAAMRDKFPVEKWSFLTGSPASIDAVMESLGYRYLKQGIDFIHPVAIAVLSPDGKIVRYLYGTRFLPTDISLALMEASEGRVGTTISRIASICFSYDPEKKGYVFNVLRVSGAVVFTAIGLLFLVLVFGGKKKRRS